MILGGKNKAVLGIYKTRAEVERAVDALRTDGFTTSNKIIINLAQPSKKTK